MPLTLAPVPVTSAADLHAQAMEAGLAFEHERCVELAQQALRADPERASARVTLATALGYLQEHEEQGRQLEEALRQSPYMPAAHWNYALWLLLHGRYGEGWDHYRWGFAAGQRKIRTLAPEFEGGPYGERPNGGFPFLWSEQGFGDTIQFLRFVALLNEAHIPFRTTLEVTEPLARLVAGFPGADDVVIRPSDGGMPKHTYHCSLVSLPYFLGVNSPEQVPSAPYLWQDAQVERKRDRLTVGLAWQGSKSNTLDRQRSIPPFLLRQLVATPGVDFVSLQVDQEPPSGVMELGRELKDFADTAAALLSMDLLITVDTAVAHLAGALGVPTWVLLPATPDWRWLLEREDSPWYETARLFRQKVRGDWGEVIGRVTAELERYG